MISCVEDVSISVKWMSNALIYVGFIDNDIDIDRIFTKITLCVCIRSSHLFHYSRKHLLLESEFTVVVLKRGSHHVMGAGPICKAVRQCSAVCW